MKKHHTHRLTAALSAAAMAVSVLSTLPMPTVNAATLSGKDAKGIVSQMKIGWNLGNTLDSTDSKLTITSPPGKFAKAWGNPEPNADQFQAVKDAGFNTVRIPTTWYQHIEWDEDSQMYLVNDDWMGYVKQTVDYAIDRDMFVILNVHHEDWVNVPVFDDATYAEAESKLTSIWTQVAETFKDYDQHLIFEGMNEPRQTKNPRVQEWGNGTGDDGYTTNYINKLNAAFVKTVRSNGSAANKERLLMLPGYCASNDKTAIRNIEIPEGAGNVALSVHAYTPYYFTMATDDKANHDFPGASGWGADYEAELSNMFDYLGQISEEKNAPIIIGEFSASDFDNTEARCKWATDYLTKAKAKGIPCVLWDNNVVNRSDGEAHGYLYRDTCTWYTQSKPVVQAMMDVYGIQSNMKDYEKATEPTFSWDKLSIGAAWKELYKSEEGTDLKVWENISIPDWQDYVNENYDFVMYYKSAAEPELVLQGNGDKIWDRIASSDTTETPFTMTFTYDDIQTAISAKGHTLEDMSDFFLSATSKAMTVYGLYAVPKGSAQPDPTEQIPTETLPPTQPPTATPMYNASVLVVDSETGKPVPGVKIEMVSSGDTWISEEKPVIVSSSDAYDTIRVVNVPQGYVLPAENEASYDLGGMAYAEVTLTITPKTAVVEKTEETFDYNDLEDGEEGKIIPISDPTTLSKIIIGVKSESTTDAAWYCGGGCLCSSNLMKPEQDSNVPFWGYKEYQWNAGDTEVEVVFDGTYLEPGETDADKEKVEAYLTDNFLELRHWWTASADAEEGEPAEDVVFEYTTVTVVYESKSLEDPTEEPTKEPTDKPTEEPTNAPENVLYGDVNLDGMVDIMDVIALNRFLLGSGTLDKNAKSSADVDLNNQIDSTDSLNILKRVVEIITLPVAADRR